jgi:hypothetical protein
MPGYFLWCSSVVLVDGTYHLFGSRWPAAPGLNGWLTESEAVRATSTNLLGPYTFQEVVLQKRAGAWDSVRIHNVRITKAGSKFVLWYISNVNDTGYAVADAVTGPWTRIAMPVAMVSNPAPLIRSDLSVYLFGRFRDSTNLDRGIAFNAPTYDGTYTPVMNGANLLPNNYSIEDPTIWWAHGQYNVLGTDIAAMATGTGKAGVQYSSTDGVSYQLVSKDLVFTKTVTYDDGTSETFQRRERPYVYTNESGEALALFTAGLPTNGGPAHVIAQPVDHYCP